MLLASCFLFLGNPKTIIFIIFVLVLFFGAKRIPELFKGVGQGVREFKDATRPEQQQPANPNYPQQHPGYVQQPNPNYPPQNSGQQQPYNQGGYPQQPTYNQPSTPGQVPPTTTYPTQNNQSAS